MSFWVSVVQCAERPLRADFCETDSAVLADDITGCPVQHLGNGTDWTALCEELRVRDIDEFALGFAIGYAIHPVVVAGHYRLVGRQPGSEGSIQPYDCLRDWSSSCDT